MEGFPRWKSISSVRGSSTKKRSLLGNITKTSHLVLIPNVVPTLDIEMYMITSCVSWKNAAVRHFVGRDFHCASVQRSSCWAIRSCSCWFMRSNEATPSDLRRKFFPKRRKFLVCGRTYALQAPVFYAAKPKPMFSPGAVSPGRPSHRKVATYHLQK